MAGKIEPSDFKSEEYMRMTEKKFNRKIYFIMILFGCILPLAARVVFMLAAGEIVDENNVPLSAGLAAFLCFVIIFVCSTYAVTFIVLLRQVIKFKNTAFTADSRGIHNTVVIMNLFAVVIAAPVRYIPWKAVSCADRDDVSVYIRVKTREIEASAIAKLILKIGGYRFCHGLISRGLSFGEVNMIYDYCRAYSPYMADKDTDEI